MNIVALCHCGNVQLSVEQLPDYLGSCNCSICRRYGALWGYYPPEQVSILTKNSGTSSYIWGDKEVDFQRCTNCGCITHYITTALCPEVILAINFRMVEPSVYANVPLQLIDGASK